jgi:DNA polymerase-3 subunit beta
MKVTVLQENLAKGLSIVGRAVASRSTLPILSNILIETDGSRLRLAATNLEIGISCWIGAKVEDPGATTVPARLLAELVGSLPNEPISMELDTKAQSLDIKCDRSEAQIKGMEATDFPILPVVEGGVQFTFDPAELRSAVGQVSIAAATDESRPILTGILLDADPDTGRLTLAAADGFRLSVRTASLPGDLSERIHVIVPAKALIELGRISADSSEPIQVALSARGNQIMFRLPDVQLVSQLIDGNFPDYQKIVPDSHATRAVVNTGALLNAARIASYFARDAANVVRLKLDAADGGSLTVSAQAADVGENESELAAVLEGDDLEIAFNAKYLMELLNVAGTDQVALELTTAASPGVFRPVDDGGFTHVIMPMHVPRA